MSAKDQPTSSPSAFAHEAFRALWFASIFSFTGTFVQGVGQSWLMLALTKDPVPVAMLTTCFTVPGIVLMMPAGVMADRWDRRKILVWLLALEAVAALVLAATTWLGATTPIVLLCGSAAFGIGSALVTPAWSSLVPELVPRALMAEAVTLGALSYNIARAIGPALGGLMLASLGAGAAFFFNAVSFLGVIAVLHRYAGFKVAAANGLARAKERPKEGVTRSLVSALRTVASTPGIRAAQVSVFAFALTSSSFPALLPVFAKEEMGTGARGYGAMLGAIGVGAVSGAFVLQRWRQGFRARGVVTGAMAMYGLSALAVSQTRSLPVAVLLLLPAGAGWIASLSSLNALVQLASPASAKSRILALYQLTFLTAWSMGSGVGGVLAKEVGAGATFVYAGAGVLVAAALSARLPLPSWDVEPAVEVQVV